MMQKGQTALEYLLLMVIAIAVISTLFVFMSGSKTTSTNSTSSVITKVLKLNNTCIPNCLGRICGGDGCGGTCPPGTCQAGQACNSAGQCVPAACTNGQQMNCPKVLGVCAGAKQTCTGSLWPGCTTATYLANNPSYEQIEVTCDNKDNDCDGNVDNGLTPPNADKTLGVCAGQKKVCGGAAGWQEPNYAAIPGYSVTEICDNIDNNCDGVVDGNTQSCYTGAAGTQGVGPCKAGTQTCSGGVWGSCTGQITPQTETCNGVDDDCNGKVDDMQYYGGHPYAFCTSAQSWSAASSFCSNIGYHLVKITDATENTWVYNTAIVYSNTAWWIGANDINREGTWVWVDGSAVTYAPWGPHQPDNGAGTGDEDCAEMNWWTWGSAWGDDGCDAARDFVCESG